MKSREKLRRRKIVKDKPRSYLLQRRFKKEFMSYELRRKLLRYEQRLPPVHTYQHDDYFPKNRLYTGVGSVVDFCINTFFIALSLLLIGAHIMLMGPSGLVIEILVEPMMSTLEADFDVPEKQLEQITRTLLINDVFALG